MTPRLPADHFRRHDESDDGHFYRFPRKVVHLDDKAIAVLGELSRMRSLRLEPGAARFAPIIALTQPDPGIVANALDLSTVCLGPDIKRFALDHGPNRGDDPLAIFSKCFQGYDRTILCSTGHSSAA
jgi:hypothetical protein